MTKPEALKLKKGDRIRMLCGGCGHVFTDDDEIEMAYLAGEIVTVERLDDFPRPQGLAVTIAAGNGVVNVYDEADYGGLYPFAKAAG